MSQSEKFSQQLSQKKVLFVCRGNVARSQMAEALFKKYSRFEAVSAGTRVPQEGPGREGKELQNIPVAEPVVQCLRDKEDIDVSSYTNKQLDPEMLEDADVVVVMAEKKTVPDYLSNSKKAIFWDVKDPLGKPYESYCQTMSEIKTLVLDLISETKRAPDLNA